MDFEFVPTQRDTVGEKKKKKREKEKKKEIPSGTLQRPVRAPLAAPRAALQPRDRAARAFARPKE